MIDGWICGQWDWSIEPAGVEEVEDLRGLLRICQGVILNNEEDVTWTYDPSGGFSVRGVKEMVVLKSYVTPDYNFEWNRLVPKKVSFVAWRALLGRLPTFDALVRRNIPVASNMCPFCGEVEETVEHVFISCGLAQSMWSVLA
ncbi:uncharacterized protein LOC143542280 [Bidens hawaiensis]|uniref:uncharacterized protein LOC143542280 n=1 Tax=Bidens hawaiensis TaxID=980011 RepID=UPI0040490371